MALALLGPLTDLARSSLRDAGNRATAGLTKIALLVMAAGLVLSAGLVGLSRLVGYPVAALVCAAVLALLALAVHLLGQALAARQARQIALARHRTSADIALAGALVRSAAPLVSLAALVAAFALARRR
jgi:hypothetical protein